MPFLVASCGRKDLFTEPSGVEHLYNRFRWALCFWLKHSDTRHFCVSFPCSSISLAQRVILKAPFTLQSDDVYVDLWTLLGVCDPFVALFGIFLQCSAIPMIDCLSILNALRPLLLKIQPFLSVKGVKLSLYLRSGLDSFRQCLLHHQRVRWGTCTRRHWPWPTQGFLGYGFVWK